MGRLEKARKRENVEGMYEENWECLRMKYS
jgi:hypothetical protein